MTSILFAIADVVLPSHSKPESRHAETHRRGFALLYLAYMGWAVGIVCAFLLSTAPWFVTANTVLSTLLGASMLVVMRRGMTIQQAAPWITSFMMTGHILPSLYLGGVMSPTVGWVTLLPILSLSMRRFRVATVQFTLVLLLIAFMASFDLIFGLPEPAFSPTALTVITWVSAMVVATFFLALYRVSDLSIRRRESALMATNRTLQAEVDGHLRTQAELEQVQQQLMEAARLAGKAEVATGALHNIGNALNGVSVSTAKTRQLIERQRPERLLDLAKLLESHDDPRLAQYARKLCKDIDRARQDALTELQEALEAVDHVASVVAIQQADARHRGLAEPLDMAVAVHQALRLVGVAPTVDVQVHVGHRHPIIADRHRTLQVLTNLLKNARDAVVDVSKPCITVQVGTLQDDVVVCIQDNGVGIPDALLARIFAHGFTTKSSGSGFGLHASALAAREMGGSLDAESDGPGLGAAFTLRLPKTPPASHPRCDEPPTLPPLRLS